MKTATVIASLWSLHFVEVHKDGAGHDETMGKYCGADWGNGLRYLGIVAMGIMGEE